VKVISLAPSITEIVCAISGTNVLAGRTSACDYPPEIKYIPIIGGFGTPSLEAILKIEPSVILATDLADPSIAHQMTALGLHYEHINCKKLDDIPFAIELIGQLIGYEAQGKELAENIRAEITTLRARAETITNRPLVYAEIWHDPIMTAGKGSFLSDIIHLAGGKNIGDDIEKDFFQIDPEWVISRNPDIIFCFYMSKDGSARSTIAARPGWKNVKAVSSSNVFDGLDNNLVLRPGPRVIEGIKIIMQKIQSANVK